MNFRGEGFDMAKITQPFVMTTNGKLAITVKTLRLVAEREQLLDVLEDLHRQHAVEGPRSERQPPRRPVLI